jgi:MFS family permease
MNEVVNIPPVTVIKDRRTGLMVFGILLIILGAMVALMIPFMLLGQFMAGRMPGMEPTPMRFLLPAVLMYLGLAVAFVWLGIGSIQCRRWARALVLIIAWMWLIMGVIGTISAGFIMPVVFAHPPAGSPPMPPAGIAVFTVIMLAICSVFYIGIPAALVFFYKSRHVQATCEARDPVPRWTDACPLPVLAISLMLGCAVVFLPLTMLVYKSLVPCFGSYVTGLPGAVILLVTAVLFAWAARATYRLNMAGWWVAFLGFALWMASAAITMARVGLLPMYEKMGFPQAQLDMLKQMGFLEGPWLWIMLVACWLPFLGYVIYTRKYFKK